MSARASVREKRITSRGKPKKSIRRVIRRVSSKKRTKVSDVEFLAFIWGAIFAAGVWAAFQYVILWLSWQDPPTLADLVGTLAFAAIAAILLTPALFILKEIVQGQFAELVRKAEEEP